MIRRKSQRKSAEEVIVKPKGFDDFELRLGDMMRGERATLGKSLLDVQRELRIKASYIAAIENSDPEVFDTPGFIAGYVRSYARYLNMNPDEVFEVFCRESGFQVAHGMSAGASVIKKSGGYSATSRFGNNDPFVSPNTPFAPASDGVFSHIELRAVGSMLILLALIVGIGYGGWSVLRQIQQVQFAPVERAPEVLAELDPLNDPLRAGSTRVRGLVAPSVEALDRLYRPQSLDVPVLVARDAPISTLDPGNVGNFSVPQLPNVPRVQLAVAPAVAPAPAVVAPPVAALPQVVETAAPLLRMVAVRPSWVRVSAADGTVIFETIMQNGESYEIPATEQPPTLHAGESGAIYFAVNGQLFGPVGDRGSVTRNLPLSIAEVSSRFQVADLERDGDLARMVTELQTLSTGQ